MDTLTPVTPVVHGWFIAEFSFASWVECECGFKPNSQEEMDAHV